MFAAAFPLAPLIALITNVIDLRIDARRMLWFNRRPFAERAEDIGKCFIVTTNHLQTTNEILVYLNLILEFEEFIVLQTLQNYTLTYFSQEWI